MKIAIDATYSLGRNLSGVGVYSNEILAGIAAAHPEARLLYCYRPHRFLASLHLSLPPNARRFLLQEPLIPRRAGVFHGLNQRLPRGRLRRAVTTFHDLFVLTGDYSSPDFKARFAVQARDAAERSALIVTVSRFTAGQVRDLLGVEPNRLRVVPHGVRLPKPPPGPAPQREPLVLTLGAIQKRKNTAALVKAFERTPPGWKLVIAGSAGFGAEEALAAIARSPRAADITVTGYLDAPALERLWRRASIFAFPSLDEGFGMPVLEAMARGVPVLTSDRSALPEVAGDAALLVDPASVEAIAHGLARLITDPGLRASLTARGLARAARFRWEDAAARTWQVYEELLGSSSK